MKGKRNYLRRFGGFILAALFLPGVVTILSSERVHAQGRRVVIVRPYRPIYRRFYDPWRRPFGYDPYFDYYSRYGHYVFKSDDDAYGQGHRDGLKTGLGDIKHQRSYDPK